MLASCCVNDALGDTDSMGTSWLLVTRILHFSFLLGCRCSIARCDNCIVVGRADLEIAQAVLII